MKYYLLALPAAVSVIAAGLLAHTGSDNWGWFLFAGMLMAPDACLMIKEVKK